jgi:DNA-binding HxlR family transcriptional regulator
MQNQTMSRAALPDGSDPTAVRREFRRVLHTISGKWKLEILWQLYQRIHRFGELRRAIPGITQHMLTAQLRELEADGLVQRRAYPEVPTRVEYEITAKAVSLKPVFTAILTWCASNSSTDQATMANPGSCNEPMPNLIQ